jgi:hypothetical protein
VFAGDEMEVGFVGLGEEKIDFVGRGIELAL